MSAFGTSEKVLKHVSSMPASSKPRRSPASVPNEMTRWLLLLSYEECVVTERPSTDVCVDVRDNDGLFGDALRETVDFVVWNVQVSSSAILNGVRCLVTVGGASMPMSFMSRSMTSVLPVEDDVDLDAMLATACVFSLSSASCETNGDDRPSSQCSSPLSLLSNGEEVRTGVACLLALICVLSGEAFNGEPILVGVRLKGEGMSEARAFALEGEMFDNGESMAAAIEGLFVPSCFSC